MRRHVYFAHRTILLYYIEIEVNDEPKIVERVKYGVECINILLLVLIIA
jgi:hypothetical protein